MASPLAEAIIQIAADDSRFRGQMATLRTYVQNQVSIISGMAGAIAFTGLINSTKETESEFLGLKAVLSGTYKEGDVLENVMAHMEEAILRLGTTTLHSSTQVAAAAREFAQAGFGASDTLAALPSVLNLASAGQIKMGESALFVAATLNQFSLDADQAARVVDVLAQGGNQSAGKVRDMAVALSYSGAAADLLGVSLEETVAVLGSLSNKAMLGSRAGTGLNTVFNQMASAEVKGKFEKLGIQIRNVTDNSMRPMADIVDEFNEKLKHMSALDVQATLKDIFTVRGQTTMVNLMSQGGDAIRKYTGDLKNAAGTADTMRQIIEGGLTGAIMRMKAAFQTAAFDIGRRLAIVPLLAGAVQSLAARFVRMGNESKNVFISIGEVIGGLAALNLIIPRLIGLLGFLGGAITTPFQMGYYGVYRFVNAMSLFRGVSSAAMFAGLITNWTRLGGAIVGTAQNIRRALVPVLSGVLLVALATPLGPIMVLGTALRNLVNTVGFVSRSMVLVRFGFTVLGTGATAAGRMIRMTEGYISSASRAAGMLTRSLIVGLVGSLRAVVSSMSTARSAMLLMGSVLYALSIGVAAVTGVMPFMVGAVVGISSVFLSVFRPTISSVIRVLAVMGSTLVSVSAAIGSWAVSAVGILVSAGARIAASIRGAVVAFVALSRAMVVSTVRGFVSVIRMAWTAVSTLATGLWSLAKAIAASTSIAAIAAGVWAALSSVVTAAATALTFTLAVLTGGLIAGAVIALGALAAGFAGALRDKGEGGVQMRAELKAVIALLDEMFGTIMGTAGGGAWAQLKNMALQALQGVHTWLKDNKDQIIEVGLIIKGVFVGAVGAAIRVMQRAGEIGRQVWDEITGFVDRNKDRFMDWGVSIIQIATNVFEFLKENWKTIAYIVGFVVAPYLTATMLIMRELGVTWEDVGDAITKSLRRIAKYTNDVQVSFAVMGGYIYLSMLETGMWIQTQAFGIAGFFDAAWSSVAAGVKALAHNIVAWFSFAWARVKAGFMAVQAAARVALNPRSKESSGAAFDRVFDSEMEKARRRIGDYKNIGDEMGKAWREGIDRWKDIGPGYAMEIAETKKKIADLEKYLEKVDPAKRKAAESWLKDLKTKLDSMMKDGLTPLPGDKRKPNPFAHGDEMGEKEVQEIKFVGISDLYKKIQESLSPKEDKARERENAKNLAAVGEAAPKMVTRLGEIADGVKRDRVATFA